METSVSNSFLLQHARSTRISMFSSVVVLGCIIITFLFAYAAFGEYTRDGSTLKYISIIFRHGDKNPTSMYINDPYKEEENWPEGWGQLTKKGKQQMYQLGETLRVRYMHFLGKYLAKLVRVDSSDHDRCHQSAGALLAALFPPQGNQVWSDQLLWQPIPIHARPLNSDKLITVSAPCPVYVSEKLKADQELASKFDKENEYLYNYLSKNTLQNITSLLDVETLFNILEIEKESGKILPSWTTSVFPEKMKNIAALVLSSFTYTPAMKKLKGGPLIRDITTSFRNSEKGLSERKLSLYAAHDLTIVSVRRALGFDELSFKPSLGSALVFELHVIDGHHFVEVFYYESFAAKEPERWELPSCETPCSLDDFIKTLSFVIPVDWDAECQLP